MRYDINALVGDESKFPLEQRIYNTLLLLGAVVCVFCGIFKFIDNMNNDALLTLFSGIILLFMYYLSIKKQLFFTPMFYGILAFILIIVPITWVLGGGTLGASPYYSIVLSAMVAILLSGSRRKIVIVLLILTNIGLLAVEYFHPNLISGYSAKIDRFVDISIGLITAIIFNAVLFVAVFNSYRKEHERAVEYFAQIEKQNLKLKFQQNLKIINDKLKQEIIDRQQAGKLLQESEKRYRNLVENINDVIFTLNCQGVITYVSIAVEKLLLYGADEVIGKYFYNFVHPEDLSGLLARFQVVLTGDLRPYEFRIIDKDGNVRYVRTSSRQLFEESQLVGLTGVLVDMTGRRQMEDELRLHRDHLEEIVNERTAELKTANEQLQKEIVERKQAEKQLEYLATHDYLTSVPNRYSFEETLKKVVAKAGRGQESFLLFIDIDNFKMVNDTKGHTAGDRLLISVAKIIKESIRESDTLARLGGDEFGVLLEGLTIDDARLAAEKMRHRVENEEFFLDTYGSFNLSFSIGVAMIDGTLNSQRLLALADTALYLAKDKGGNRVILLEPNEEATTKLTAINQLVAQIKNAVKEDKFVLFFQPVVRVVDRKILHHEALLRMQGQDGELISPQTFIAVAEQFGLMPAIDRWVIRAVLETMSQHPVFNIFVNISGVSLGEESLLDYIEQAISQSEIEPSRIGFEITETAAVQDIWLAQRWIERLRKLGCRFALDDFGIGFSTFSYLRSLSVDYVKIDGSFIVNLDKDPSNRALVMAMNTVAHSLGKKAIAEYVENEDILKILQELEVDFAQGYFCGRPGLLIDKCSPAAGH